MAKLTVYTKLLDRTLEGARIIDMGTTKSCECIVVPRDKVMEVAKEEERLTHYSFYILLGRSKGGQPMAYVGQTNDFTTRVSDHKQKKDFWDTALVFVSKSNEIFASETLYLEYLGWKAAKEANNYIIENTKDVNQPQLSADKQNEMELFFDDILFLTRFYGCKVFDRPEKKMVEEKGMEFRFKMSKTGVNAVMLFYRDSKRYVIRAGSQIFADTLVSCNKTIAAFRKEIVANKKLAQAQGTLCNLLQDIEIPVAVSSPSGAASFCAGTSYQGPDAWVDKDGKKYPSDWWKE